MLILGTIMTPFILVLTFLTLLTYVFAIIPAIILCMRWIAMYLDDDSDTGVGDMKIPTFYAAKLGPESAGLGEVLAFFFCTPVVGGVFGGIHCAGWFFTFPSSAEAMLWRVSSAVLTGIAFLLPFIFFITWTMALSRRTNQTLNFAFTVTVLPIFLVVYVVTRLLLIVEAFISLRHLTPGMLALVKWTSFIPHI